MITMLLGGLWHGANWTFVFWGGYHGLLLILHRAWGARWDVLPQAVRNVATMLLVIIGWVFFRSETFAMAVELLGKMFVPGGTNAGLPTLLWAWSLAGVLLTAGGWDGIVATTRSLIQRLGMEHGLVLVEVLERHSWGPPIAMEARQPRIPRSDVVPACCDRSGAKD
jgi:hypothetical protein